MANKVITFTLGEEGVVTPTTEQKAGVQGSHNVTEVRFDVSTIGADDNLKYRIQFIDGAGGFYSTGFLDEVTEGDKRYVSTMLPDDVTNAGGLAFAYLVVSEIVGETEDKVLMSDGGKLRFGFAGVGSPSEYAYRTRISNALVNAEIFVGQAEDFSEQAKGYKENAERAATTASASASSASASAEEASDLLQELKNGIASGKFKGDKGDDGPQGPKGDKGDKGEPGEDAITDQRYDPESENAQSGKAVAEAVSGVEYFGIETDGTIYLKPEYRGSAIDFKTDSSILGELGDIVCGKMVQYSQSDNGFGENGSKINSLPEVLYIPNEVNGIKVKKLAPAMFAYNKRVKQIVLPQGITTIPNECFAYAIHLGSVKNVEGVTSVEYGSFFASGVLEIDLPNLTTVKDEKGNIISLGKRAFMKAGHLKRVHLGKISSIPDRCFEHCTDLKTIEHDSHTPITTVGNGAFFNTTALKEVDFLSTLTSVGDFAFSCCALNFDWSTKSGCTFGKYATPLQMNPTLTSDSYNIKTNSCNNNAPLRIDQENPKWVDKPINALEIYKVGCAYFSVMNAYCGIRGIDYDTPYELADINKAIPINVEEVETMLDVSAMDKTEVYDNYYGNIVKYIGDTNSTYTQNHYYRAAKDSEKMIYYWHDIGTQSPTNLDLFLGNSGVKCFDDWISGLGLIKTENKALTPNEYPNIIKALQNGSYVMLNIPRSYNAGNGHAIILHGVNSNGEVLFVNSSVPSRNAIGDYTAVESSCLLQNLTYSANVSENKIFYQGSYTIISEGETKTLLNEKTDQIWSILEEVLKTMDLSIMKTHRETITQAETTQYLTASVDFEPKIVFFKSNLNTRYFKELLPTPTSGFILSGMYNATLIKQNVFDGQNSDVGALSSLQIDNLSGTPINVAGCSNSIIAITTEKNDATGKWDIKVGSEDAATSIYRIIGGTTSKGETATYDLFVVG